ncbi:hypothetical protein [Litorimonas haliclonae]|uniref:hypothetical protein n=1 Tax=Litorimonas haliclonae TaxID=2081977 RepID=UPI0039F07AEC
MKKQSLLSIIALFSASMPSFGGCQTTATAPPSDSTADSLQTLTSANSTLSAEDIMSRAHGAAGGAEWVRPKSLVMDGYSIFYDGHKDVRNERHRMWRVYDAEKSEAHHVDGKVRILSERHGVPLIDLSYNGQNTYTAKGQQPKSESDKRWASNFGFGVIRHAFDEGYTLSRLPDDLVDGRPVYMIRITDPAGGETQFGIAQNDYAILKVGFDTPRGWHERIYSNFYSNPNDRWVQPGRVRLYYNGVKSNEVIWTSYKINSEVQDCLFVLPNTADCKVN